MHPVEVKCIKWAVELFLLGALTSAYGSDVFYRLSEYAGINASAGLAVVSVVIGLMAFRLMPLGASLVNAAVTIQALAPYESSLERSKNEDSELEHSEVEDSGRD